MDTYARTLRPVSAPPAHLIWDQEAPSEPATAKGLEVRSPKLLAILVPTGVTTTRVPTTTRGYCNARTIQQEREAPKEVSPPQAPDPRLPVK
jgi:hypothetical protein